jgi:hypothetical protein
MRWPFTKKTSEPTIPPVEEQRWAVAQEHSDDAPLLVRVNESARDLVGHPGLPIKLGFAIPLNRPNDGGLPDTEENEELLAVEDLIVAQVLEASVGIHALTLTNGVMKEYVFYVPEGLDFAGLHAAVRARVSTHDVQCMADHEPRWDSYCEFSQ